MVEDQIMAAGQFMKKAICKNDLALAGHELLLPLHELPCGMICADGA